jgi:DNA-binding beta-propeller fold protein YncE
MTSSSAPRLRIAADWGSGLPDLRAQDISDITVDADDNVYLLYRNPSFIVVSSPAGVPLRRIGEGLLGPRAHGVTVYPDGRVLVVDSGSHRVLTFNRDGNLVGTFGSGPSNPAFTKPTSGNYIDHVDRAYPPFTLPTRVAVMASDDLFISDGYGNCRVHHCSAKGRLIGSWGEPGTAPGQFHTPHDIFIDRRKRVLVCDRENDRIQVFDGDGGFLDQWTDLQRPQAVVEGPDGLYYVAEGAWRPGHVSPVHGRVEPSPSRVSILSDDGSVVTRFGGTQPGTPGSFLGAHGLAVDSHGDVYVAEVAYSLSRNVPALGGTSPVTVQKFIRWG